MTLSSASVPLFGVHPILEKSVRALVYASRVWRWAWILLASACSRDPFEVKPDEPTMPAFDDVGIQAAPTVVVTASASAPPVVVEPPPMPKDPEPDAKWLARFEHSPSFGFVHHPRTDVARTLTKLFIAAKAKTPDATAVDFAATVRARSLVVGEALPGCGNDWTDAHLIVDSPDEARTAAHALLARVAAPGTEPTPWSNGFYSGERVSLKRSGRVSWDDGGLLGILFHGDEVVFLRAVQINNADGDCPDLAELWPKTLRKP